MRVSGVILLLFLLLGCQSREVVPKRTGHEFVPVQVGSYWEYAVTTTTISAVNGQSNELSELRLKVTDSAIVDGGILFLVQRMTRLQGETIWQPAETWSFRVENFRYVQQEGNIPYMKLQFPLTEDKSWNGNSLNAVAGTDACGDGTFACDNYRVSGLYASYELPGVLRYEDTVTIVENDEDDPIVMKDQRWAVYANQVGLVHREEIHLEYCTVGPCIGEQVVENGLIRRQTLTTYGVQ